MTQYDILRLAQEAGFTWEPISNIRGPLERFAALVAAAEREACAKMCETQQSNWNYCAAAIRARSTQ